MRFGLGYNFRNPPQWRRPTEELYERTLEQIELADRVGFDGIWMQEHHFWADEYLPSPFATLAYLAGRTRNVRLGTDIVILPLHNPLRIAEDVAVTDILSGGRVDLGVGLGYHLQEYETLGVPHNQRGSRLEEGIQVLRQAWGEGHVEFSGRRHQFHGVEVTPKPIQGSGLPIFVSARVPAAARRAARLRCHLSPTGDPATVAAYLDELDQQGHDPGKFVVQAHLYACVTDNPDKAWRAIQPHFEYQFSLYTQHMTGAGDAPLDLGGDQDLRSIWFIGDADHVAEQIVRRRDEYPFNAVVFSAIPPGLDPAFMNESVERLGTEVIPQLRNEFAALARPGA